MNDKKNGVSRIQRHADGAASTTSPPFYNKTAPIARSLCGGYTWHGLHILVTAPFCCDRRVPAARAQSFTQWQQATIEITRHACSCFQFAPHTYIDAILSAHPVCGASRMRRCPTTWPQQYDADLCLNHCYLNILRKIRQFSVEADSLFFLRCRVCSAQT